MARPSKTSGKTSAAKTRKARSAKGRKPKTRAQKTQTVDPQQFAELRRELDKAHSELAARNTAHSERIAYQEAANDVLKVMSASPGDPQPVFDLISVRARDLCDAYGVTVYEFDGSLVHWRAATGVSDDPAVREAAKAAFPLPPAPDLVVGRAILRRATVHIRNYEAEPELRRFSRTVKSTVAVPLLRGGLPIGALQMGSRERGGFSDAQVGLLQTFADQAVIAIENARLFNEAQTKSHELQEALRYQTGSANILNVIASSPADVRPVLKAIAQSACELCEADDAVVHLLEGSDVCWAGHHGPLATGLQRRALGRDFVAGRAIIDRATIHLHDVLSEEGRDFPEAQRMSSQNGLRTMLAVPMVAEGKSFGDIMLRRTEVRPFSDKQIALLQTFADQAVIAIENARLFNETKEALARQTATSDVLKVIASSPSNLQPVFDAIAERSNALMNGHATTVFRFIGETAELAAFTSVSPEADAVLCSAFPRPISSLRDFENISRGQIAMTIDAVADTEPETGRNIARARGFRGRLVVPLKSDSGIIGAISITRKQPGAFAPQDVELLRTFADQAVIAIQNVELFEEVQARTTELTESLQQQTATAEVLKVISSSVGELDAVFSAMLQSAARICDAAHATIFFREEDDAVVAAQYGPLRATVVGDRTPLGRDWVAGRAILDAGTVHVRDASISEEYPRGLERARTLESRATLAVPLIRDGVAIGAILLRRREAIEFTAKQVELVTNFASQAVIAIENARLLNETQEALERQTATAEVLNVINSSPGDLAPVFDAILEKAHSLCGVSQGSLLLFDGDKFRAVAVHGIPEAFAGRLRQGFVPGPNHPSRRLLEGARFAQVPDCAEINDPVFRAAVEIAGIRTVLFIPLRKEGSILGQIAAARRDVRPFTEKEVSLLENFAAQAVIAIENARLFNELQTRTRDLSESLQQQTATADVLDVISRSAFDLNPVFATVAESAVRLCGSDRALIFRFDGQVLRLASAFNAPQRLMDWLEQNPIRPGRYSVGARAALERQTIHVEDVLADPEHSYGAKDIEPFRTVLGVPMLKGPDLLGVIMVYHNEVRPFTDKQIELVSTFADQAVIAIENARLFDEVQAKTRDLEEALTYQTGSANILKVIASSPTEVGPVLKAIVESACELCEAYDAVLRLKQGDILEQSAHHGTIPADWNLSQINPHWTAGRAALERKPVHVHDMSSSEGDDFPEAQARARIQGHRTILSIPLLQEDKSIGTITLRRLEVSPFSEKQIELLQTFADQAVIALGNVRLFEEVQARTREVSEALEYQTATGDVLNVISRSPNNLQPVLESIVDTARRLCEAEYALILRRADGDIYQIAAHSNASKDMFDWMQNNPVKAGDGSAVGIVVATKKTVHLPDVLSDSRFTDLRRQSVSRVRTALGVPLMNDDEVVGVIFLARTEVKPFSDRQVDLVTNFADQAVIAISNVNLFEQVQQRTRELAQSLDDLRAAQDRLVQTEKLASLGQLTAGIAHEIKNPLNFVNNFSALSVELTDELNDLLKQAALADQLRKEADELTGLLKSNLEKVVQHGKRADSIVKNMLLHSREGSGELRAADINGLVEESLNLAYHGARAEKSSFNITLQRDLDASAGSAELFPQEITRALLNLISNGFYAATKRKTENGEEGFEPTLSATTRNLGASIEIRIRDNGTGIPPEVKEKIFNPFFTTKPAGEGTGLGLSMSHDIIVKQHGGTIRVETEPGVFTEFIVTLPRATGAQSSQRSK